MVPERAARKILDRIATAKRLGGLFQAEAAGMLRALCGQVAAPEIYGDAAHRASYVRGYSDATEILAVEAHLAAKAAQAQPVAHPAAQGS